MNWETLINMQHQQEIEFTNYRTEKREEIQAMAKIIESMNMSDEFTIREKDLLLRSFIVLVYAYWESCYHRIQKVVLERYLDLPIEDLPFQVKNKVYLSLISGKAGRNKSKPIKEITNYNVFQNINLGILENQEKKLSEHNNSEIQKSIFNFKGNPSFEDLKKFMAGFNIRIERTIEKNVEANSLYPFLEDFITFIIKQRNAIAHKNEKINYADQEFRTYFECINYLKEEYETTYEIRNLPQPSDFIKEMLFQIDQMFTFLIEEVDEQQEGSGNNRN